MSSEKNLAKHNRETSCRTRNKFTRKLDKMKQYDKTELMRASDKTIALTFQNLKRLMIVESCHRSPWNKDNPITLLETGLRTVRENETVVYNSRCTIRLKPKSTELSKAQDHHGSEKIVITENSGKTQKNELSY